MPFINRVSHLNLTNELDLLEKHPNINYLFLPFETSRFNRKSRLNQKLLVDTLRLIVITKARII